MSFDETYRLWLTAKKDLKLLLKRQDVLKTMEVLEEKPMQFKIFSEMYILYADLVNKLSKVYLHTLQVQKRVVVRTLMESALNRFMELKNTLKDIELSEYIYMDKNLIKRKMVPSDMMIWRSPHFLFRRPPELQNIHCGYKLFVTPELKEEFAEKNHQRLVNAIVLIQAHERARKARIYQNLVKADRSKLKIVSRISDYEFAFNPATTAMSVPVKRTLYSEDYLRKTEECIAEMEEDKKLVEEVQEDPEIVQARREKAARVIQKFWYEYKNKKQQLKALREERYILGVKLEKKVRNPKIHEEELLRMYKLEAEKRRLDEEYLQLIEDERTRIFQERAPWIMEDISDHIRGWFRQFYDMAGAFHPYPDEIKGGTVLVLKDETMNRDEFAEYLKKGDLSKEEKKKLAQKAKQEKAKEKAKAKKEKQKLMKRLKQLRDRGAIDLGYELSTNKHIQNMEETLKKYSLEWRFIDEYLNKNYDPIKDWVTEEELAKAHEELRLLVDEYMRTEYELLQKAWCLDEGRKYKKTKNKKKKNKKKKGKKKPVDPTEDRTLESLYMELKEGGFIDEAPRKTFNDYIAEFNFLADDTRDMDGLTTMDPSIADIKMLVEESIIGMGEFNVPKPKSLLLIGPFLTGKKLLCNIIASELDALVINLSPERTYGIEPENMNYFLHVVMKVAKAFEPTLLYIQDAHRVFWKKVPPEQEDLNPLVLSGDLQKKILKPIKKDDRIMLLGTSDLPWTAKGKFKKLFQKVILVPRTDYGSAFLLWLNLLEDHAPDQVEDYYVSTLAKCMKKYTPGEIAVNVQNVLDVRRKMTLNAKKLNPEEFLAHYIERTEPILPVADKILKKFDKWYRGSNKLAKKRAKFFKAKMAKMKKK